MSNQKRKNKRTGKLLAPSAKTIIDVSISRHSPQLPEVKKVSAHHGPDPNCQDKGPEDLANYIGYNNGQPAYAMLLKWFHEIPHQSLSIPTLEIH